MHPSKLITVATRSIIYTPEYNTRNSGDGTSNKNPIHQERDEDRRHALGPRDNRSDFTLHTRLASRDACQPPIPEPPPQKKDENRRPTAPSIDVCQVVPLLAVKTQPSFHPTKYLPIPHIWYSKIQINTNILPARPPK